MNLKMRIAHLLDKLPWTCWAELCAWAMGYGWFPVRSLFGCASRSAMKKHECGCWCLKFCHPKEEKSDGAVAASTGGRTWAALWKRRSMNGTHGCALKVASRLLRRSLHASHGRRGGSRAD